MKPISLITNVINTGLFIMQKHLIYILQSILLYSYKFWSTAFVA